MSLCRFVRQIEDSSFRASCGNIVAPLRWLRRVEDEAMTQPAVGPSGHFSQLKRPDLHSYKMVRKRPVAIEFDDLP